ncbi:MAG: tetratricopeptide (TPR) repeat protein [Paracoccaceae bacterium]
MKIMFCLMATLIAAPAAAAAPVRSYAACLDAVDRTPEAGREAAAEWARFGGGLPARICEALALSALGAHSAAAQVLDRTAATAPGARPEDRAEMLALAAQFWRTARRGAEAEASANAALSLVPGHGGALRVRGLARLDAQSFGAAAADLTAAARSFLGDAGLWTARAAARAGMFDHRGALQDAGRALALTPDLAEALLQKGLAEVALGDKPAARESLLAAIDADAPGGDVAARARSAIQTMALGG